MKAFNKLHLLLLLNIFLQASISQKTSQSYSCGSIQIQEPFSHANSILTNMILCKSDKLYFRTSIGMFPISTIDYSNKLLVLSHPPSSSTSHFHHLSAGFPPPSTPNSLLLLNCKNQTSKLPLLILCNKLLESSAEQRLSSCWFVEDVEKLDEGFRPNEMECSYYSRVYRNGGKLEVGTRISFDIPDHVPNPCNQCEKPDGFCGAGLRCVCHPKICKDRVISVGAVVKPDVNLMVFIVCALFTWIL